MEFERKQFVGWNCFGVRGVKNESSILKFERSKKNWGWGWFPLSLISSFWSNNIFKDIFGLVGFFQGDVVTPFLFCKNILYKVTLL